MPEVVVLEGADVGSLAKLLSLRLTFTASFTNVLSVRVEASLKQLNITLSMKLDQVGLWCFLSGTHLEILLYLYGLLITLPCYFLLIQL